MTGSVKTWKDRDNAWFEEVIGSGGNGALRITIRANSYQFQSYGRVERWDGTQWHLVTALQGEQLEGYEAQKTALYGSAPIVSTDVFAADVETLKRDAGRIMAVSIP